jgi:mannose-6-phosphate isomerase class I
VHDAAVTAARARFAPFALTAHYVVKPWGGRRIADDLGRQDLPDGPVGEAWDVVDLPGCASVVAGGPLAGRTLREVWGAPFPLFVKVLDAREDLSVQLHPDGVAHGGAPSAAAKEEAWVALGGGGAVALRRRPPEATGLAWMDLLERIPLRPGDGAGRIPPSMIHIPPGTVHAILGGSLVVEVQNPADTTWRLYDHGRVDLDGRPRALHLEEAAEVLRRGPAEPDGVCEDGRRLRGRRFELTLLPPGRFVLPASQRARVLIPLGAGEVDTPVGPAAAARARPLVLPTVAVHGTIGGWSVLAEA